jgi:hypothetical protein
MNLLPPSSELSSKLLKMGEIGSSETQVMIYQTIGHNFLGDNNIHSHQFENLEFHAQQLYSILLRFKAQW